MVPAPCAVGFRASLRQVPSPTSIEFGAVADFATTIAEAYATTGPALDLGRGVLDGAVAPAAVVQVPLATMNRHGLIAGATGTGKTRTLQLLAEGLSAAGVPVFAADYKGDLSGMLRPGADDGPAPRRMAELGLAYAPTAFPVEFASIGGIGPGAPVRATVTDFGPELLAKVLRANETQAQTLALLFPVRRRARPRARRPGRPARTPHIPRLGRRERGAEGDRRRLLADDRRPATRARRLEDGGGTEFFGEPQFEIADLLRRRPTAAAS